MNNKKLALAIAGGTAVAIAVPMSPASAEQAGPWYNNACDYAMIANDVPNHLQATTYEYNSSGGFSCSNVWVELHYKDSKGNNGVLSSYRAASGMAARVDAPDGSTYQFSCHAGRSASAGNWSVVRKVGPAAGTCGAP